MYVTIIKIVMLQQFELKMKIALKFHEFRYVRDFRIIDILTIFAMNKISLRNGITLCM